MTDQKRPVIGRLAALLVLFVAGAALYTLVFEPVATAYGNADADLSQARETLTRLLDVAEAADEIREMARTARTEQASSGVFLVGDTNALAAAELQQSLGRMVRTAGADLRSAQSLPPENEDGLMRVGLRVQVVVDTRSLTNLLYQIEVGRPLLFVDDIKIRGRLERTRPGSGEISVVPNFLADFSISGYRPEAVP